MKSELCVPADAVSVGGGEAGGAAVAPGVGDSVEITSLKGTVTRAEGGNVYVTPTEVNGQPIAEAAPVAGPLAAEDDEASMDEAMKDYGGGVMAGALLVLLALFLSLCGALAQGKELQRANRRDTSPIPTNNWVAFSNQSSLVFSVEIDNFSGSDIYLFVFERGTNAPNGSRPDASVVLVPNGTTGGKNWGSSGCPFDHLSAAASTTPFTSTNAAAGTGYITVVRRRDP